MKINAAMRFTALRFHASDCEAVGGIMKRTRPRTKSFEDRIAEHGRKLKEEANLLPPGKERDELVERVRQTEMATRVTEWLGSGGVRSSK
ncbi:hypothetical protein SAMN05444159_7344 [Bradyrhizobium lablabi]|uniref:Uncharacterized protein n=2 Tax=Bradyrhizobium lablabi TaxID=722472 RepID=A0A1M7F0R1_9BRAD|nr:hypothetical protein SAMN05444159_7344 [Bradyrhizobium lablabi]